MVPCASRRVAMIQLTSQAAIVLFPNAVARTHRHPNRLNRRVPVELPGLDMLAQPDQELLLPLVGTIEVF